MRTATTTPQIFVLTHNGVEKFRGLQDSCFYKLLRSQSQSTQWAMRHEGWKIEPFIGTDEEATAIYLADPQRRIECELLEPLRGYGKTWYKAKRKDTGEEVQIDRTRTLYSDMSAGATVKASQNGISSK